MDLNKLQQVQGWLDRLIGKGKEVKTAHVTEKSLHLGVYDDDEKHQAMLEGLNQKSRVMIRGRFRFQGRSCVASKGIFSERAYQRDKFLTSDEMKERHQYFSSRDARDQKQAAYWAKLHGAAYGQQLALGFSLSTEDEETVNEWVANEMQ